MSEIRTIRKIVTGTATQDGAGVKLVRVIGKADTTEFDPFLMLDAFDSRNPEDYIKGFPWHPHRGIETITAGSGIIHQEMPKASERMLGAQLWLNLPAKDKMVPPKYHGITKADIPVIAEDGAQIHIIGGTYKGTQGAVEWDYIKPLLLDVEINSDAEWTIDTNKNANLFIYIFQGAGAFDAAKEEYIAEKHAVLFNEGSRLQVKASDKGMRFLLMAAEPLHEPVAWGGPIVMNTKEELDLAFQELKENTFIKHKV